ncbi:discoidin domain-containing protein [Chloroflexota bacterium]
MTKKLWLLMLLGIMLLPILSCTTRSEAVIHPLDNLPGGFDGPHVQNIKAHSADIVFESMVPIVCNIAYGTDTEYGRLTLMAMTGPLTDHNVSLLGLEPNTTYHYRITVTDVSSNVYQSGDFSFSTAQATEQERPTGTNVASDITGAKVIGVSSNWGDGDMGSSFGGNKAIDGRSDTEWSSNGDGDKAWIEIELAQQYDLTIIGFWTRTMGSTAQISSFRVVTEDGTQLGPFEVSDAATIYYFDVNIKTSKLRFEIVSS